MEFIKQNAFDFDTMGRYKYVFSSDSIKQFYFNTPSKFDPESNRWFSQFQYTYCTFNGFCEAAEGDGIDILRFWREYPDACLQESYYNWEYKDESCNSVNINYIVTEFSNGDYFQYEFAIEDVTEEQFADIDQALMIWHKTGELIIDDTKITLSYCGKNPFVHSENPLPEISTAELIEQELPVDRETVLMDLKARTGIQEELHEYIAEIICRTCRDIQEHKLDTPYNGNNVYCAVINDLQISQSPWLHKDLEDILTDPIPFA